MIETVDQSFKYRHYSTVVLVAVVAIAQLNHDPRVGSSPVLGPSIFFSGRLRYCRRWQNLMEY